MGTSSAEGARQGPRLWGKQNGVTAPPHPPLTLKIMKLANQSAEKRLTLQATLHRFMGLDAGPSVL